MKRTPLKRIGKPLKRSGFKPSSKIALRRTGFNKSTPSTNSSEKPRRTQFLASQSKHATKKKKKKGKTPRQLCWDAFSLMIRLTYADDNGQVRCYTCDTVGNWEGEGFQAGHLVPGRGNSVYVNRDVVRVQCSNCNMWNGGEQYKFGKRMEKEVGEERVAELMDLKGKTVKISNKDWNYMMLNFLYEAKNLAEEKGQILPTWTNEYLINT